MRTQIAECKLIILGLVVLISGCLHVTQILLLGLGTICSPVPLNVKEFFLLSLCFLSPVGSLLLLQLHRRVHTHTHSTKWRFCLIQIMSVRLHWSIPGDTFLNKDSNELLWTPVFCSRSNSLMFTSISSLVSLESLIFTNIFVKMY